MCTGDWALTEDWGVQQAEDWGSSGLKGESWGGLGPWLEGARLLKEASLVNGLGKHLESLFEVILCFFCK